MWCIMYMQVNDRCPNIQITSSNSSVPDLSGISSTYNVKSMFNFTMCIVQCKCEWMIDALMPKFVGVWALVQIFADITMPRACIICICICVCICICICICIICDGLGTDCLYLYLLAGRMCSILGARKYSIMWCNLII